MAPYVLLAFQAASALAGSPDERLLHPVPSAGCHASGSEIVVCGKDADTYRLPQPGPAPDLKGPLKAEWGLGGGAKLGLHGEQHSLGTMSAPAAMATVTIPF